MFMSVLHGCPLDHRSGLWLLVSRSPNKVCNQELSQHGIPICWEFYLHT